MAEHAAEKLQTKRRLRQRCPAGPGCFAGLRVEVCALSALSAVWVEVCASSAGFVGA
jgi:hypothetical protein